MITHTPEPWYLRRLSNGDVLICAAGKDGDVEIATVHRSAEYEANLPALANAERIIECVNNSEDHNGH